MCVGSQDIASAALMAIRVAAGLDISPMELCRSVGSRIRLSDDLSAVDAVEELATTGCVVLGSGIIRLSPLGEAVSQLGFSLPLALACISQSPQLQTLGGSRRVSPAIFRG